MAYANATVIKNPASVKIDTVEYQAQVDKVRFVPDTQIQTKPTFGGVDQDRGNTTWVCELSGHQSYKAGGLAKALATAAAADTNVEIVVQILAGAGQEVFTATLVPLPVEMGGSINEWRSFEIELPVVDAPVQTLSS